MNHGIVKMEYYEAMRKDGVALFMTKWNDLQDRSLCGNSFVKEEVQTDVGMGVSGAHTSSW